jgi:hypothetical protein
MTTIAEAATELRRLKELEDAQNEALKATKAAIERITKTTIPEILEAMGAENARIPGIGTVYLQNKVFANVKAEDRDKFHAWLRENGHGDLIKDTVHPGTLTSFAKEQLENGIALPEYVQAAFVTQAALRKA